MGRRNESVLGWWFSLAILLGAVLAAEAETPTRIRIFWPAPAGKRAVSSRKPATDDPLAQRQVMVQQIGFEAQQQGYASKVQGAASQNVSWVTPHEQSPNTSRRSWLAPWRDFFDLSE